MSAPLKQNRVRTRKNTHQCSMPSMLHQSAADALPKRTPHGSRSLWKRRVTFVGLGSAVLCALFLPLQIRTWRLESQLNQLQNERQALLSQQQQIQQQITYYSSDAYVEEAARSDLDLVKPGEALVLPAIPGQTKAPPKNYPALNTGPYGD